LHGQIYFNNASLAAVTHIYVEKSNYNSVDISALLATAKPTDTLKTRVMSDVNKFGIYRVLAVTEETTLFDYTVEAITTNGAYTLLDRVVLEIQPTGAQGATGATGPTGSGVPAGGLTGQVLAKNTDTNYDTVWIDNYAKELRVTVKNMSGGVINKGQAVMATGATGDTIEVTLANADGTVLPRYMLGIAAENIASEASGYVTLIGAMQHLNTLSYPVGTVLWLNPSTPGGLTATEPVTSTIRMPVAIVTRQHAVSGRIYVRMYLQQTALHELFDVKLSSLQNGNYLRYDSTLSAWKNDATSPTGATGATGPGTAVNATATDTNATFYPVFVAAAGSNQTPSVDTTAPALSYNPSTDLLNVGGLTANKYATGTGIVSVVTGTTRSLSSADNGIVLECSSSSAVTVTVPTGLPVGFTLTIIQTGTGQISFSASGTTINNRQSHTKTAGRWAVVSLIQRSTNNFILAGDTAA
jgi:hypothetical protein